MVGKGEASYLPCTGAPKCPSGVGGACTLHDVQMGRPSLIDGAQFCGGYLVLGDLAALETGDTYVFDARDGSLVASVSMTSESYRIRSDGRLSPSGTCSGPATLRVGPLLWPPCTRAKWLAFGLAVGDGKHPALLAPDAGAGSSRAPSCTFSGKPSCPVPTSIAGQQPCSFSEVDERTSCHLKDMERYRCGMKAPDRVPHDAGAPWPGPYLRDWPEYRVIVLRGENSGTYAFDGDTSLLIASWHESDGQRDCRGPSGFVIPELSACDEVPKCFGSSAY